MRSGAAVALLPLVLLADGAAAATVLRGAAADYVLNCAGCHKFDGSGSARVPVLTEMGRLQALPGGREYLVRVPGVAQAPLSDARLAALLNWLITELGTGGASPPYDAAEVGTLRAAPLRDPIAARAALVAPPAPAHLDAP